MKYQEYYIESKNKKSNCVIRSLCKILNKDYEIVFNELCSLAKELNCSSFNDIEVFETYMKNNGIDKISDEQDKKIKDLDLDDNTYVIFCYDKKDFYHMVPIINNTVYDYSSDSLNLYVISIYKVNP